MEQKCSNCGNGKWRDGVTAITDTCTKCRYVDKGALGIQPNNWKPKEQTNADRIRAMSDEELARHLHCIGWDCHLCAEHRRLDNEPLLRNEKCDENCFEHCLEWLKQPAEVDND